MNELHVYLSGILFLLVCYYVLTKDETFDYAFGAQDDYITDCTSELYANGKRPMVVTFCGEYPTQNCIDLCIAQDKKKH